MINVPNKTELVEQLQLEREEIISFILDIFNQDFLNTMSLHNVSDRIRHAMADKYSKPVALLIGLDDVLDKSGSYQIGYFIKSRILSIYSKVFFGVNLNDRLGFSTIDKNRAPGRIVELVERVSFNGNLLMRNRVLQDMLDRSNVYTHFIEEYRRQGYYVDIVHKDAHSIISIQ